MADRDEFNCSLVTPSTAYIFGPGLTTFGAVFTVIGCVVTAVIFTLYVEQTVYLQRRWNPSVRRNTTFSLLSLFPFVAFCSFLSLIIPRSGTIVDLMINTFVAYCMEAFLRHIESYYGSAELLTKALDGAMINPRGPPCCCCCICLPVLPMNSKNYSRLRALVLQASVVRPMLMIIAAVLWTNGDYSPGVIAVDGTYIYINILNMLTTLLAVYAILRIVDLTKDHLAEVHIKTKMLLIQGVVISTVVFNILSGILVSTGAFPCTPFFSSTSRGERIYHFILIILMLPLCILARYYYLPNHMGIRRVCIVKDNTAEAPSGIQNESYTPDDRELPAANGQNDQGDAHRGTHHLSPIV